MGKKPVVAGGDGGPNTIYKATYSGVPVYEMLCQSVAVMRRRSDAYLNATQILKVAGFDKPQRTRVLEREVQKGEHEKVQGGYGKYQGTWIPIERGLALAKQYGVEDLLRPIIDYVPTSVSPPPAPKHAVAPPTRIKKDKDGKPIKDSSATPSKAGPGSVANALPTQPPSGRAAKAGAIDSTPDVEMGRSEADSRSSSPDEDIADDGSSSSDTPSPVASGGDADESMQLDGAGSSQPGSSSKKRPAMMMDDEAAQQAYLRRARGHSAVHTPRHSPPRPGMAMNDEPRGPEAYTEIILNYFVSETTQIPSLLVSPPADYDPNSRIDEDGHTALHWACAMGRVRIVKLLLTAGASVFAGNNSEQTPLMRSVMFSNNYDVRKFPELYELLHRSTLNIDKHNRTVFHHIANLALTKGKTHAARYYMETILHRLADYPQELADVINFQDEDGETALTLSARARSRRLVKALLDHGADPKIKNRDFKSAEDYILEDERFRSSPVVGQNGFAKEKAFAPQLYSSEAARMAGGSCLADITSHMQNLARSFDAELQGKEREILQAKALLTNIHAEVTDASRLISSLSEQTSAQEDKRRELETAQNQLRARISEAMRKGYEIWLEGERAREARWRKGQALPEDGSDADLQALYEVPAESEVAGADEEQLRWEIEEKRRTRQNLVRALVKAQTEAGTGEKTAQYRRLISAGLQVPVNEVDGLMSQMLETIGNESMTTSAPVMPLGVAGMQGDVDGSFAWMTEA